MNSSLYDFFESYGQSLEQFDAKRAAGHYKLPCLLTSDEGATAFTEVTKLEALFVQGYSFFRQNGIAHARPELLSRRRWTDGLTKCKVQWSYFTASNELAYACEYQYLVRQTSDSNWKIEVAVSINEREQVEAWVKRTKNEA